MKTVGKLTAAVAMALSLASVQQAQAEAEIELKTNGLGDALLFPVFNGYINNYFTINNTANEWIQGHIRFRGAAWSGELRDFDVILSPGDVLVFRVADVDGDGQWDIDQSLDGKNFMYTAMHDNCTPNPKNLNDDAEYANCYMTPSNALIPTAQGLVDAFRHIPLAQMDLVSAQQIIDTHKNMGYVEFIGEAILNDLTHEKMERLLTIPGEPYQTKVFKRTGTTAWAWSDAENNFAADNGLLDVPNVLSGTAFINLPGQPAGLAYNAEALANFRTSLTNHRIDNYRRIAGVPLKFTFEDKDGKGGPDTATQADYDAWRAVIVHDDNGAITRAKGVSPKGDYVYAYSRILSVKKEDLLAFENLHTESRISFNNTWGPTLQDGDDYNVQPLRMVGLYSDLDNWDTRFLESNSIAEVEEAIRKDGQIFHSFYFDKTNRLGGNGDLWSSYFAYFPTKFYYGERADYYGVSAESPSEEARLYRNRAIADLLLRQKFYAPQVWDYKENQMGSTGPEPEKQCISPSTFEECHKLVMPNTYSSFMMELTPFDISIVKSVFKETVPMPMGRLVIDLNEGGLGQDINNPANPEYDSQQWWTGLLYTYEFDTTNINIEQWRSMQR